MQATSAVWQLVPLRASSAGFWAQEGRVERRERSCAVARGARRARRRGVVVYILVESRTVGLR